MNSKDETELVISKVNISGLTFFAGCSAVLDEKTVLVHLSWTGQFSSKVDWAARWDAHLKLLRSNEPLWGLTARGLPVDCLAPGTTPAAGLFAVWVVALTVAVQRWARQPVWQGAVLSSSSNSASLALPYQREDVFRPAFEHAVRLMLQWSQIRAPNAETRQMAKTLDAWLEAAQLEGWQPNTLHFFAAARQRGIPTGNRLSILKLGQGSQTELLDGSFTGRTSGLAGRLARSKKLTSYMLGRAAIPVPAQRVAITLEAAEQAAQTLGWPVVVKPDNQDGGLGVRTGIGSLEVLRDAYKVAAGYSPEQVIIEKHVDGHVYRLLVVAGSLRIATQRLPGGVMGDGVRTVQMLLDALNAQRGIGELSSLRRIDLDSQALDCLAQQALTPSSVPARANFVRLRYVASMHTGGTPQDVTEKVHPDNRIVAERAARLVGLDIAGVDFLCPDISRSWREVGGAICEVNGQPAFRMHWLSAPHRDINGEVLDWLYENKPPRIPTAAIAGTHGTTVVARLLHHMWRTHGKTAGLCTAQGVWMGDELVSSEDMTAFQGVRVLMDDPAAEAAVMVLTSQGLATFGHPCDRYDVVALLNVQVDAKDKSSIEEPEQLAKLMAQALTRARHAVVINADDPLCMAVRERIGPGLRQILVACAERNSEVVAQCAAGGQALLVAQIASEPWVVWADGSARTPLMCLLAMPVTGKCQQAPDETHALFAMALAAAQGLPWPMMCRAVADFSWPGQAP